MNNHYIQSLDDDDLAARCLHFLSVAGLSPDLELLRRAMPLVKERMKTLSDSVELLRFLFTDDIAPDEKAARGDLEGAGRLPEGASPTGWPTCGRGRPRRSRPGSTSSPPRPA